MKKMFLLALFCVLSVSITNAQTHSPQSAQKVIIGRETLATSEDGVKMILYVSKKDNKYLLHGYKVEGDTHVYHLPAAQIAEKYTEKVLQVYLDNFGLVFFYTFH